MAGYWFPHEEKKNDLFILNGVKSQENVGALGASLKVNPGFTKTIADKSNKGNKGPGSAQLTTNIDRARAQPIREVTGDVRESWKQKKWGNMTGAEKFQAGASVAASALNTLDMLTGGQDTILPGSGHTYSSGYNPQMYIGAGPGY